MSRKQEPVKSPDDAPSWGETQIIAIIREAYASQRSPEQVIRERAVARGGRSAPRRKPTLTQKLGLVTVYRRRQGRFDRFVRRLLNR